LKVEVKVLDAYTSLELFVYSQHPEGGGYMSYEEEDTCHMRRRIHVIHIHEPGVIVDQKHGFRV
jgi:hypothetical protein